MSSRIRLTWEGKMDAAAKARKDVSAKLERLNSVGRTGTGNAVVFGEGAFAAALAGTESNQRRFDLVYVNADAAVLGLDGGIWAPQRLSNLLQILIRVKKLTDSESWIAVRMPEDIPDEAYLAVKEVFSETHQMRHVPALQGKEGHCGLAVACPMEKGKVYAWHFWHHMLATCCPKGGSFLSVGIDDSLQGLVSWCRLSDRPMRFELVFPLETIVPKSAGYLSASADAYFALEQAAETGEGISGFDVFEAVDLTAQSR